VKREKATSEVATHLKIPVGSELITIERVRTADDKPVVYTLDTFPKTLVQGKEFDLNRLLKESLYQILQSEFGHVIEYGAAQILPATASGQIAEMLNVPAGSLLLYIVQTDYSSGDQPILYSREYHLPDAFDFMIWRRGPSKVRGS